MANPQVGAVGVAIEYTVKENGVAVDISAATNLKLRLQKPRGRTTTEYTAAFKTNGSDGVLRYVTASAGDLDRAGMWGAQANFTLSGFNGPLAKAWFYVEPNLVVQP